MKVEFLGVGEAFDPSLGNTSVIIHADVNLLVDCGYVVPKNFFERGYHPDYLDAVYFTHFHADHTYGVAALLSRLFQDGRTKPLTIIGQPGVKDRITQTIDFGYPNIRKEFKYPIDFQETVDPTAFKSLKLSFAETNHPMRNFGIRIEHQGIAIGVSGDGAPTDASAKLFSDCDLLIHEAFRCHESVFGHASAEQVYEIGKRSKRLKRLALVHIDRQERIQIKDQFLALGKGLAFNTSIPEPGEIWEVG